MTPTEMRVALIEGVKRLSGEDCKELIKAITVIAAVPHEQGKQIVGLRKAGLSIEQIAERFGVAL